MHPLPEEAHSPRKGPWPLFVLCIKKGVGINMCACALFVELALLFSFSFSF